MKVRTHVSDDDTLYRVAEVSLAGRTVETPSKALVRQKIPVSVALDPALGGFSEAWRTVGKNQLTGWMADGEKDRAWSRPLRAAQQKAAASGDLHLLILELDTVNLKRNELEFLSDTVHSLSDLVVLPLEKDIHKVAKGEGSRELEAYKRFAREFVEEVEKLNGKPFMGMVPSLPWQLTKDLTTMYLDMGMRAFCFDFAGRTPSSTEARNIRPFLKELRARGIEEEVLLYALNANTGRAGKKGDPSLAPAKDILAFGFGFDVLGMKHMALRGPKEMYEAIAKKGPQVRLFDKDAYGYRRAPLDSVRGILPRDTVARPEWFDRKGAKNDVEALINMEQHAKEARRLRKVIGEDGVRKYLAMKKAMEETDRRRMREARSSLTSKSLDMAW